VTVKEIADILEASIIANPDKSDIDIKSACSTDMMSAVLYYHTPNSLLITSLNQPQVIRTAEIAGIKTIVFVLNKKPDQHLVDHAANKHISLLTTPLCMFTASGRLYKAGLPGCSQKP
jgi:hypothetical protein